MNEIEIIDDNSALGQIERANVDMQIATARKYPRSLSQVKQTMLSYATLDEETAASCFYTLPGRKGGDGKPIQGPSVRLAEIAISSFQHIKAGSRIISDDGKFITAQGVVHDLQNNVVVSIEVKRRVTTKEGRRYSDDMVATTGNAACSIALRNAAFRVIPLALVTPVYEAVKKLAIGDSVSLVQRRAKAVDHFLKMGVSKEKIAASVNVRTADDIGLEQLETLLGYATAIKDGAATVDEIFNAKPDISDAPDTRSPKEILLSELKARLKAGESTESLTAEISTTLGREISIPALTDKDASDILKAKRKKDEDATVILKGGANE